MINRRGIRIAFFLLSLAVSTALAGSTVVILAQCGMPSGRAANTNTQNNNTNPQSGMDMGNMDMSACPCPYCKGKGGGGCAGEGGSCHLPWIKIVSGHQMSSATTITVVICMIFSAAPLDSSIPLMLLHQK